MNEVERLAGIVAGLSVRVARLEEIIHLGAVAGGDQRVAAGILSELGHSVTALIDPVQLQPRLELAGRLRDLGWSFDRMARVLHCAQRTVRRWCGADPPGDGIWKVES